MLEHLFFADEGFQLPKSKIDKKKFGGKTK
jgi:hypothetical protein